MTMARRFSGRHKDWPTPDLILIDGGKGQLSSALSALEEVGVTVPTIGLAKREEDIVVHKLRSNVKVRTDYAGAWVKDSDDFMVINLNDDDHITKLLQRIRDESHRFAVSYHTHLKRTGQTKSALDDIPSVGQKTRKKLLKEFGSLSAIQSASVNDIAKHVGLIKAKTIKAYLK